MIGDQEQYEDYEAATLTAAIIARGKKRIEKRKGCKHIGYLLSGNSELTEWCEDPCIWAGGDWRLTQARDGGRSYMKYCSNGDSKEALCYKAFMSNADYPC